ncbi:hypothetical protein MMC10_010142 [Thelotrema lepadinum]|nr:hypothetical protein [Thelotrema lepadinum]
MGDQSTVYGQVVSDGQQTVTFAGAVVNLLGRPVSSLWQKRTNAQKLRDKLGEWAPEAQDAKGHWLKPVLRTKAFEDHLTKYDGRFTPSGTFTSCFAWAQLLYALDIGPGRGVLAWRLPADDINPTDTGQIGLDMDGKVLCHIINLYRTYDDPAPTDFSRDDSKLFCYLPFGKLSIEKKPSQVKVVFESGTVKEISAPRQPFSVDEYLKPRLRLRFEDGAVITRYYNAMHHNVSDMELLLPKAEDPLKTRVHALLSSIDLLEEADKRSPYIITQSWIEQASRVKRRVTTNGGMDFSIGDDVVAAIQQAGSPAEDLDESSDEMIQRQHERVRRSVRAKCMSQEKSYRFSWPQFENEPPSKESFRRYIDMAIWKVFPSMLKDFAHQSSGSWRHVLSEMAPEVMALFKLPNTLEDIPIIVLEMTPGHELWTLDCQVQG